MLPGSVEIHSKTLAREISIPDIDMSTIPDQDSENERNQCGKFTRQTIQDPTF